MYQPLTLIVIAQSEKHVNCNINTPYARIFANRFRSVMLDAYTEDGRDIRCWPADALIVNYLQRAIEYTSTYSVNVSSHIGVKLRFITLVR